MGPRGALEAAVEARRQGLVRFIGVTGHGWTIPAMHRRSLARFDFDSVLLPFNFLFARDERYRKAFDEVLATCRERNVAVQIIKSIARGPWATTRTDAHDLVSAARGAGGHRPGRPLDARPARMSSSTPPATSRCCRKVLDAASRFERRPPDAEMDAMVGSTRMTSLFGLPA